MLGGPVSSLVGRLSGPRRKLTLFAYARRPLEVSLPNHHPSRSWRGCAMCKPHKRRGAGRRMKDPVAVQRRLGITRRYSRKNLGA